MHPTIQARLNTGSHTATITASFDTIYDSAFLIAENALDRAVKAIDKQFGDKYAEDNPELVGTFMRAAMHEIGMTTLAQQVRAGLDSIAEDIARADTSEAIERAAATVADAIADK